MKRTTSRRSERLADLIMREIATILEEECADPRLELVSISGARLNADLSVVEVLYTLNGDAERVAGAGKALDGSRGRLRSLLGSRLKIKFVPELRFVHDTFLEDMVYAQPDG